MVLAFTGVVAAAEAHKVEPVLVEQVGWVVAAAVVTIMLAQEVLPEALR
jgi:hypothetical protein